MVAAETAKGFFPSPGETIAGKYEIERMLGQGGMGAVFLARNTLTARRVALKWVLPDKASQVTRARLLREAQATCSVRHPNVVDVYDVCDHEGGLFIVMEYLSGKPLSALLESRLFLQPEELVSLLMPAMRGVQAAHDAGIIHRDLKPDNILLCDVPTGEMLPKVLDFGISKTLGGSERMHTSLTNTGALIGTPHFMALEQVDGSGDIDVRTDVYAFGVMLYQGLTGQLPFDGENIGELILKIGTRAPVPPRDLRPQIPVELEAVVMRAIARRREDRFSSVAELALALEPFSGGVTYRRDSSDVTARRIPFSSHESEPSSAAQTPTSVEPPPRRHAWMLAAAGLALVAAAGALWVMQRAPEKTSPAIVDRGTDVRATQGLTPPAGSDLKEAEEVVPAHRAPAAQQPAAAIGAEGAPEGAKTEPSDQEATAPESGDEVAEGAAEAGSQVEAEQADERRREVEAKRQRKRRAARARRKLDKRDKNADNRIRGQRTPGLSADDF